MPDNQEVEVKEVAKTDSNEPDFSKVAEALNRQHNPLEEVKAEEFVARPFFEEEVKEEVSAETTEIKPELNEDGTPKTPEVKAEEGKVVEDKQVDLLGLLNTTINDPEISFSSVEEIKAIVAENRKFKEAEGQLRELTQEERARIEIGREYGDFGLFDRVMSIDTDKITPKEALRQVYFLDNIEKNPQFLEKAFEKEYIKTYEEESDEEFSKMLLENNGQEAINQINELKNDLKKRGQISGGANPEDAKKAKEEQDKKWFADVDKVMSKSDRVTYNLEGGLAINIVMDAKDKQLIQNAMDRPVDYLKSLITDENGNYDHEALFEFIIRNEYYENALEEARKSGAATREERILKEKKNVIIDTAKAGDAGTETKLSDQLATNFRQLINH
jgi:hypothetical protein